MKTAHNNRPPKSQAIVDAEKRRNEYIRQISMRSSMLAIAYELFSLIRKHPDIRPNVQHLAMEQYGIALSLDEDSLASLFFYIAEYDCYIEIDGEGEALSKLKKYIKSTAEDLNLPLQITADQKQLLEENSLPILSKMVEKPESSVQYFYELVEKLDELVQAGKLDWQTAAGEVYHTLDRPQIYAHESLEPTIIAAYDLSAQHDKSAWDNFSSLVKKSDTA